MQILYTCARCGYRSWRQYPAPGTPGVPVLLPEPHPSAQAGVAAPCPGPLYRRYTSESLKEDV